MSVPSRASADAFFGELSSNPVGDAFLAAILSFIPFMGVAGYLSYRVNKRIERLSKVKIEPRAEID